MLIFRIEQETNNGYDTYDSAIVVACDEEHARCIHPAGYNIVWDPESECWVDSDGSVYGVGYNAWAHPDSVTVERIGMVTGGSAKPGEVVCASFHAG